MFERSIPGRIKSRKGRLDKIERKEQYINNKLFKEYFTDYQSPSNMYKKLIETENAKINKTKVDFIKKILNKLQRAADYVLRSKNFNTKPNA